jgi:hypothetical protein
MSSTDLTSSATPFWYGIRVRDPELASSSSFKSLVADCLRFDPCDAVRIARLEVVFRPFDPAKQQEAHANYVQVTQTLSESLHWSATSAFHVGRRVSVKFLHEALDSILQLVWGRFFFYKDSAIGRIAEVPGDFLQQVLQSSFTICVQDNSRYVVLTHSCDLPCALLSRNWQVEIQKDALDAIVPRQGEL